MFRDERIWVKEKHGLITSYYIFILTFQIDVVKSSKMTSTQKQCLNCTDSLFYICGIFTLSNLTMKINDLIKRTYFAFSQIGFIP